MKRLPILALLVLLASCVPGASVVAPPTFHLLSSALVSLEPPGVGRGAAVVRLELEARNPNPIGLQLAGLDGDFYLNDRRVASSRFPGGVAIPAQGSGRLTLDVEAPLEGAPHLLAQMARLLTGSAVPYRLDGTLAVEVLGTTQRFPSVTVARGELPPPPPLRAPTVRFDAGASGVRLDGLTAVIDVGLAIDNPLVLGFWASGPQVEIRVDGRPVGRASVPATPVPALGTSRAVVRVEAGIAELGAALMSRLQSGGLGLEVGLRGDMAFEIPGVTEIAVDLAGVGGPLR